MTFQIDEFRKGKKMTFLEVDKLGTYRTAKGFLVDECTLRIEKDYSSKNEKNARDTFNRYKREIEREVFV